MFEMREGDKKLKKDGITKYILDGNNEIVSKKCAKCSEIKGLEKFNKYSANKFDGRMSRCEKCEKQYREENKELIAELRRMKKFE